jgi:hypothetical protein
LWEEHANGHFPEMLRITKQEHLWEKTAAVASDISLDQKQIEFPNCIFFSSEIAFVLESFLP